MAVHTATGIPAHADPLADFDALGRRADRRHLADDLVAEHDRKLRIAPVIVENRIVGVAKAAVLDCDFYVFGSEIPQFDRLQNLFLFGRRGDPDFRAHAFSLLM